MTLRSKELPDWFHSVTDVRAANFMNATTVAFERDGNFYFDGAIAAMMKNRKIPHTIEIALDAETMVSFARLNYGDETDEHALYTLFEVESFAFLWNSRPKWVHGIRGSCINLYLNPGSARYPIINAGGVTCELYLKNDLFFASPDPEFAHELGIAA